MSRWKRHSEDGTRSVAVAALHVHEDDVGRAHFVVRQPRGRDQQAAAPAYGDIARGALIDAEADHAAAGFDDALPCRDFPGLRHVCVL